MTISPSRASLIPALLLQCLMSPPFHASGLCVEEAVRDPRCAAVGHFRDWCNALNGCAWISDQGSSCTLDELHCASLGKCVGSRTPCSHHDSQDACVNNSGCHWDSSDTRLNAKDEAETITMLRKSSNKTNMRFLIGSTIFLLILATIGFFYRYLALGTKSKGNTAGLERQKSDDMNASDDTSVITDISLPDKERRINASDSETSLIKLWHVPLY
jgi:hypothetical protein